MIRNRVLWYGGDGDRANALEFSRRGLMLAQSDPTPLGNDDLIGVRAVVYSLGTLEMTTVREHLVANLERIEDHGAVTVLLAAEDSDANHLQDALAQAGLNRIQVVRTGHTGVTVDHEIAQLVTLHDPGMAWSPAVRIEKDEDVRLTDSEEILLRRAFSDSKVIRLERLSAGNTGSAYRILAQFEKRSLLVQPLPYFAKLGQRRKIEEELANYREYADFYIPFHLRPNVDPRRVTRGARSGCLVGNFVEGAKPLWVAVEEGEYSAPINALFDITLRGWWAQAFSQSGGEIKGRAVAAGLGEDIFDHAKVRPEHLARARRLGLKRTPIEIMEALRDRRAVEGYFEAPFHADLHPDNVFVRNGDAIVIDLGSARLGPIGGDPACLEVALALDVRGTDAFLPFADWRADVDRLFAASAFERIPLPVEGATRWQHRLNAVRKVRTLALAAQTCETGYQSAIATYLLRRSMYASGAFGGEPEAIRKRLASADSERRAYALVLAERLVFKETGTPDGTNAGTRDPLPRRSRKPSRSKRSSRSARR